MTFAERYRGAELLPNKRDYAFDLLELDGRDMRREP
jgi:ATP-dependent DNA ligase